MKLIRRCIAWCHHQLDLLDRVLDRREAGHRQAQVRNYQNLYPSFGVLFGQQCAQGQFQFSDTTQVANSCNTIGENYRSSIAAYDLERFRGGFVGTVAHDGTTRCFKWDGEQGCYVPLDESRAS